MSSVLVSPRNGIALARQSELDFECLINGAVVEGCLALGDARNVTSCRLRGAVGSDEHQQSEQAKHFQNSTSVRSQRSAVRIRTCTLSRTRRRVLGGLSANRKLSRNGLRGGQR